VTSKAREEIINRIEQNKKIAKKRETTEIFASFFFCFLLAVIVFISLFSAMFSFFHD